jgi:hypothetical protein
MENQIGTHLMVGNDQNHFLKYKDFDIHAIARSDCASCLTSVF